MSDTPTQPDDLFWIRHGYKDKDGRVVDDPNQQVLFGVELYKGPPKRGKRARTSDGPTLFDQENQR